MKQEIFTESEMWKKKLRTFNEAANFIINDEYFIDAVWSTSSNYDSDWTIIAHKIDKIKQ